MNHYHVEAPFWAEAGALTKRDPVSRQTTKPHFDLKWPVEDPLIVGSLEAHGITPEGAQALTQGKFTGFKLGDAHTTQDQNYAGTTPEIPVPKLSWLQVHGKPGVDDLGMEGYRLIMSERALQALNPEAFKQIRVQAWEPGQKKPVGQ